MQKTNIKQKLLAILIAGFAAIAPLSAQTIWDGTTAFNWTGAGTEADPYLITTPEQLAGIAKLVEDGNTFEGKYIKLDNDIWLNDPGADKENKIEWTPIGQRIITYDEDYEQSLFPFSGTFDGGGYTVKGVYTGELPDNEDAFDWFGWYLGGVVDMSGIHKGFFGYVIDGTIKNLHLANVSIQGQISVGGLVAHIEGGTISNCSVTDGAVFGTDTDYGIGGLAGCSKNTYIENSYATVAVMGTRQAGGLVGTSDENSVIKNSYATGDVLATQYNAGGFVGTNKGVIESCYATGNVEKSFYSYNRYPSIGGFAAESNGTITLSYATGNVTDRCMGGAGFVGNNGGTITDSYAMGDVFSPKAAGFVVLNAEKTDNSANRSDGTIINCYSTGHITDDGFYAGGPRGFHYDWGNSQNDVTINSYYNGETSVLTELRGDNIPRTTAQMQSREFADTLNMVAALLGTSTWEYRAGEYPKPTGIKATNITDYLQGGDGSKGNPFLINNKEQLKRFAFYVNTGYDFKDKYIKLTADIVLNPPFEEWGTTMPTQWTPIGYGILNNVPSVQFKRAFSGTFDGGGYEISNLYVESGDILQGLFGIVHNGTIENLAVTDAYVKGKEFVGALAGYLYTESDTDTCMVSHCWTTGYVEATTFRIGGLIGTAGDVHGTTMIRNSYSMANVKMGGNGYIGGLAGVLAYATMENCYATGNVSGTSSWTGGLVGAVSAATIVNGYYDKETSGKSDATKGLPQTTAYMQSKEFVNILNCWVSAINEQGAEQYLYWHHADGTYPTFTATVPPHSVAYNSNGGSPVATHRVLDASKIPSPPAPEKEDYTFGGWYSDEGLTTLFDFNTEITASMTLYAKWFQGITPDVSWYNNPFATSFCLSTKEQLAGLALLVNGNPTANDFSGKTIKLCADILLNDTTDWQNWGTNAFANQWTPIGTSTNQFKGTFDGDGYKIGGVYIDDANFNKGLFGYAGSGAVIKNLGVTASFVRGTYYVGGVVGYNNGAITNCYSAANVKGTATSTGSVGGVVGYNNGGAITDCHSAANVNGTANYTGGLVGYNIGATANIINSYATGNVSGTSYVGGLAGGSITGSISNSYATGNVTGTGNYIGGLAGISGNVSNSYATGNVGGTSYVGGLLGQNNATGNTVTNCYAAGNVTGTTNTGGLVGYRNGTLTVTASHYDSQTTGQTDTGKGTSQTTAAMKQKATFTNWDFTDIWGRNNAINNGYPYLRWSIDTYIEDDEDVFAVTGVTLNKTTTTLIVDATEQLIATIAPANATNKAATWSSSDPNVVNVVKALNDLNAEITALTAGTATITVTTEDGAKTATCVVTVNALINAQTPTISAHPQGATVTVDDSASLSVTASVTDGGTLSYQWYSNTADSNSGGTPVGTNSDTYAPSTATEGTMYYYVVVTNTNNAVNGEKTATVTSNTAAITVNALVNAQTPTISAHPQDATVNVDDNASLSVTANVTDGGTLSYQWYSNTADSNSGGTPVGTNSDTCAPSTATAGTMYYYVVVTNTNNAVNGEKTATVTSNTAAITVNALVNAQTPTISAHPQGATITVDDNASLSVTASVTDGGTLSYQWYSNTTNSNSGGTLVGTNSDTYAPSTATVGTMYYYVVVTNTNNAVNGEKTATVTSNTAAITVNALVNAQTPTISAHPQGATVTVDDNASLSVTASVTDGGTLSYQWYSNTADSNSGGTPVGTNSDTYAPSTATEGTMYYYVVVTNTNNAVNGEKTATITSNTAAITVNALVNAQTPTISAHPQGATITVDDNASLSVTASVTDGGTLSYQWYSNTTDSNSDGTAVGANSDTYAPSTATAGTMYYYVVVTNTNNAVNGEKTATVTSNTAAITVNALVNAQTPTISAHPQGATITVDDNASLSVTASVTDGGILSYQWYSNTANSNSGGTLVGTNSDTYAPSTATAGTMYYYVVVTNTNNAVNGEKTATATSNTAAITVNAVTLPVCTEFTFEADAIGKQYLSVYPWDNAPAATVKANPAPTAGNARSLEHKLENYNTMVAFDFVLPAGKQWSDVTGISVDIYAATTEYKKLTLAINDYANAYETANYDQITDGGKWKTTILPVALFNSNYTIAPSSTSFTLYLGVNDNAATYFLDNIKVVLVTVTAPNYISANEAQGELKIYPNPFSGEVHVMNAEGSILQVVNIAGIVVHTQAINSRNETLALEQLSTGVYFFRFDNGATVKMVKVD